MSEQASTETDHKAAKAEAAAAKARAKASRPWYRKKRYILLMIVGVIALVSALNNGGDDTTVVEPAADEAEAASESDAEVQDEVQEDLPEEAPDDAEFANLGEEARDGKFAFTVNDFECIGDTLEPNDDFLEPVTAQGQFCVLELTVENIGDEAQGLATSNQYLYDDQERRYSASDDVEVLMAVDSPIYDSINPGNSMDGTVVFDVPEGAAIEFAGLHDSALSGGVLVDLR